MTDRRQMLDGPYFSFTYLWSGVYPDTHALDLSGSGCTQDITWERIADTHTLDRGNMKRYDKGWKLNATLVWGSDSLILRTYTDVDTYYGRTEKLLNLLYNTTCNEQVFYYPYPSIHSSSYFDVIVVGDYNLQYVKGLDGFGYRGSIELIGKTVFPEIPRIGIDGETL